MMGKEGNKGNITPEQLIRNAFEYFHASELDQESLVRIAIAGNCPTREMAVQVLKQMTKRKLLRKSERDGKTFHSLPPSAANPHAN